MEPIETLISEHRLVADVLRAADAFARAVINEEAGPDDLRALVGFIREYVDGVHHGKEETILFVAMSEHGFSPDQGPIAVMLAEHDEGRELVQSMDEAASFEQPWSREERRLVAADVTVYAALLRAHIQKEDEILYPIACRVLPQDVFDAMQRAFARFDAQHAPAARRLERSAADFIARFGPRAPAHAALRRSAKV